MSLVSKLQALITYANSITSKEDTTVGDAIKSLADGYGQGGGSDDVVKSLMDGTISGEFSVPSGVTILRINALSNCGQITKLILPEGLTRIRQGSLSSCTGIKKIIFPSTLTTIDGYSCENLVQLNTIEFPESLTSIGAAAFNGSWVKRTIIFHSATPPTIGTNSLSIVSHIANIYVPADSVDAYKEAFTQYADYISAIEE